MKLITEILEEMADHGRTVRKIRQGKVDIDYEESSLVVHYDLELVSFSALLYLSMIHLTTVDNLQW